MPHLTIDYSSHLADVFDRVALLKELHPLVVDMAGSTGVCKTFLRPAETYAGNGTIEESTFVHVEVGLMPGRSESLKARLSESILALLSAHLPVRDAAGAVLSVEVRDLAGSYRLSPKARGETEYRCAR
ncbi:5-carboxymethyl-2-hydroxymuconate delta isomerase [Streptomyces sp. TRM S81-3]|uniref:5-carboxymethyl-2-hydroxymuconate delta isomerase n=1 Tax=Streptomyces griseicoloratus TaxID=2752516 RepID=A0A926L563_9ACTN|nr:5-carboxymethyl-2-hydroxymuconate delta isomerase [Streptomyces griseicoloratus]MBD0421786.1 5-carboxymethyl-2-hydroxymuconate delta isomerase [Streptomyces griseicoloratus]